jgi:hypothetical protein
MDFSLDSSESLSRARQQSMNRARQRLEQQRRAREQALRNTIELAILLSNITSKCSCKPDCKCQGGQQNES